MLRPAVLALAAAAVSALAPAAARAEPARPADAFADGVGVNVHVMHTRSPYWDLDRLRGALRTLGVRHVRDGLRWYESPSQRWYNEELERRLGALGRDGVGLQLLLPGPDGAVGTTAQALDVAAGLPNVTAIEATNEWDLNGPVATWPDELRAHTRDAFARLRAHRGLRGVPLVGPGFGRNGSPATTGDLSAHLDLGNGHPYANGSRPELPEWPGQWGLERNIAALRLVSGAKPYVLTEAGYHNAVNGTTGQLPVSEEVAAVYHVRTLLEHARLGAARTFLYELADSWDDPGRTHQEGNMGLFRADWSAKPAADAVANLLSVVRDHRRSPRFADLPYAVSGAVPNLRTMAFARAGGRFVLAVWRAESIWNGQTRAAIPVPAVPATLSFGRRFRAAKVFRPTRGAAPVAEQRDAEGIALEVDAEPTLVELVPTERDRVEAELRAWWCRVSRACRV